MPRREPSWWNGDPGLDRNARMGQLNPDGREVRGPSGDDFALSPTEQHLFLRLRSLEAGSYTVQVVRTARGRGGLHSFHVQEAKSE